MNQEIINLYDEYTHAPLSRKDFLNKLARLTGSTAAALALVPLLESNYSHAATVAENDHEILTQDFTYEGVTGMIKAYLARPNVKEKVGAVMVIHENRGLNPHIKDITRRIAKAGFLAIAPDALSEAGGTPPNEDTARDMIGKLEPKNNLNNFLKGLQFIKSWKYSNGNTGCLGFCWGGGLTNQIATHDPFLKVAVSYYGMQPAQEEVASIKSFVQLHYAGLDERINAGIASYDKALKEAGVQYEQYIYEGVQHAFNNNTSSRYNPEAAALAWERTLKIMKAKLS